MRTAEEEQTCGKGLAERLEVKAREMAGHRDLPMGRHNMEAMAGSKRLTPFERYVRVKRELLGLVQATRRRRTRQCWQ